MSASPPPIPPSRAPEDNERRFKHIGLPCEWIESYHPGGYHPVHLGDFFNDGQYKVIRKLGDGSFSTVWLAHDLRLVDLLAKVESNGTVALYGRNAIERRVIKDGYSYPFSNNRYVALKIMIADMSVSTNEVRMLGHIAELAPTKGPQYVTQLLSEFEHRGPNGTHRCLVFEPMGPTVNSMVEELPQFKPRKWGMKIRYPPWMAKSILKQSLQALSFLHENGIAHGDFQPGNMLFALDNIDSEPEDALRQNEDVKARLISPPVQRLDGKQDKWAPRYLCIGQPLASFTPYREGLKLKLSDMGSG